ncbi:hypothetical protein TrVFT333_000656 [Trichoderma virens FT-333]|nr:hypothetical protein TrVFT333_000656 [Trichoderma virens FT-333]
MGSVSNGDNYVLGRSVMESVRLDGQHFIFKLQNGYTIHPQIPITPDTKIAEIGTGTGIWLLDVSSQVPPTVQLNGFDISEEQFPAQSTLPKPGGYLQWEEYNPSRSGTYINGAEAEALYSFASMLRKELDIDPSWLVDIPNRVKKAGLNVLEFPALHAAKNGVAQYSNPLALLAQKPLA